MSNERMEFYDNEGNERQVLTLEQFVAIFCLERELNYVISTEFKENSDIIFKEINKSLYNQPEDISIAFSENKKKLYLIACTAFNELSVNEIGYNDYPNISSTIKYDRFGNLKTNE